MNPAPFLLIAYKFPPYAGVGGFRWAKLSKYLARLGHEAHVVTAPWPEHGPNTLSADVRDASIHVHPVPTRSPLRVRHAQMGNRWLAAARHYALRAIDSRFFFDDEAQRWSPKLFPVCERLIAEHGIEVVIATGHPFQANRHAAELKRRNPGLKLIQDFRDPWADNPFRKLPAKRLEQVRRWQAEAVADADAVVAVTQGLLDLYAASGRAEVIPNGVDPETVPSPRSPVPGPEPRLVHIGNVSNGRDRPLAALLDALRVEPTARMTMVGAGLDALRRDNEDLIQDGVLELRSPVTQAEALRLVAEADYALQLNAREFPYLVSTKIYEYAQLRVPVISLNYGGEIDALVREHGFGHSLDLSQEPDLHAFVRSLPERATADRDGRFGFEVEPFTHPLLAQRYSALIDDLG